MLRGSVGQTHSTQGMSQEVVGIPSSVNVKDLESKVHTVFNRIGVAVKPDDIEACHRLDNDKKQLSNFQNVNSVRFCE